MATGGKGAQRGKRSAPPGGAARRSSTTGRPRSSEFPRRLVRATRSGLASRPLWLRNRIAELRQRAGGTPSAPARKKRISRHERDLQRQRLVKTAMLVAGGLIVLILVVGTLNDYVFKPRQPLANVNGVAISRADYWKKRAVDLLEQSRQYQQFADMVGPDQGGQYLQLAAQARAELPTVWGSTDVDDQTLSGMVDDQLFLQGLDEFGLAVTPAESERWMLRQFQSPDAPLETPTPAPTLIPERAAIATSTADAQALADMGAPGLAPTTAPMPNPPGRVAASPVASTTTAAPADPAVAQSTAEAGLTQFEETFFPEAHLTRADFARLVAVPAIAREKVQGAIAANVGQVAPQVEARHILVATQDLARQLKTELDNGSDFADLARTQSTDEATAGTGGELGWFVAEEMVAPFADVAFSLQPGATSEPFETEFGWHIVQVAETDPARALTDEQITRIEQVRTDRWLEQQRTTAAITSQLEPTPTPAAGIFEPPLDAPQPPPPTEPATTLVPATPGIATPVG